MKRFFRRLVCYIRYHNWEVIERQLYGVPAYSSDDTLVVCEPDQAQYVGVKRTCCRCKCTEFEMNQIFNR